MARKPKSPTEITSTRHKKDTQLNIPTEELRDFVRDSAVQFDQMILDIACWFVDTNYNGESFFVRHAYFTGGDEPYEKLKRALRAEIDEGAWSTLYSTVSRPFAPPDTGKIAVEVINHYGDEVLKVYDLATA